jgi:hypothetical protein
MHKAYFLAPVLSLLVFSGLYISHVSGIKDREAAAKARVEAELAAKNEAELAARKAAMADAIAQAELRKQERAAKEAAETLKKEQRQVALDAKSKAYQEQEKVARLADRLKKEIEAEEAALAKLQADAKTLQAEEAFLLEFVAKAQGNARSLGTLVEKLNAPPVTAAAPAK